MTVHAIDPCFCGQPATRTIGAINYCHDCAETVLAPIRAEHPSNWLLVDDSIRESIAAHPASRLRDRLKSGHTTSGPGDACDVPDPDTTNGA
jgi:hypothetical protein